MHVGFILNIYRKIKTCLIKKIIRSNHKIWENENLQVKFIGNVWQYYFLLVFYNIKTCLVKIFIRKIRTLVSVYELCHVEYLGIDMVKQKN